MGVVGQLVAFVVYAVRYFLWGVLFPRVRNPSVYFQDKTVLITGAASGMGKATAVQLARRGCFVFATDVNLELLKVLKKEISNDEAVRRSGGSVTVLHLDVGDQLSVDAGFQTAAELLAKNPRGSGKIDFLVSNAGLGSLGPATEIPESEFSQVFQINTMGTQRCAKAFVEQLRPLQLTQAERGHIVVVTSGASFTHFPFQSAYAMSKAALEALCDSLRLELAPVGIRVSVVVPTAIETPIWDSLGATGMSPAVKYQDSFFLPRLVAAERFFRSMRPNALPATAIASAIERHLLQRDPKPARVIVDPTPTITGLVFATPDWLKDFALNSFVPPNL